MFYFQNFLINANQQLMQNDQKFTDFLLLTMINL